MPKVNEYEETIREVMAELGIEEEHLKKEAATVELDKFSKKMLERTLKLIMPSLLLSGKFKAILAVKLLKKIFGLK